MRRVTILEYVIGAAPRQRPSQENLPTLVNFYGPLVTTSYLAGITKRSGFSTSVLILYSYRQRMPPVCIQGNKEARAPRGAACAPRVPQLL